MSLIENKKTFSEVQIGDIAYNCEDILMESSLEDCFQASIVWKGSYAELMESKYSTMIEDMSEVEDTESLMEYDYIVAFTEDYGNELFVYDSDPCSLVCSK